MTWITYLALAVIYVPVALAAAYVVGAVLKARWRARDDDEC